MTYMGKESEKEKKVYVCESVCWSVVSHFSTPWTIVHKAHLSMGFSRGEHWSGLPFPSPGDLADPGNQTQVSCIMD